MASEAPSGLNFISDPGKVSWNSDTLGHTHTIWHRCQSYSIKSQDAEQPESLYTFPQGCGWVRSEWGMCMCEACVPLGPAVPSPLCTPGTCTGRHACSCIVCDNREDCPHAQITRLSQNVENDSVVNSWWTIATHVKINLKKRCIFKKNHRRII